MSLDLLINFWEKFFSREDIALFVGVGQVKKQKEA
jgi:hypothetical protein